jgi:DNA phosphorothioation-dependent restriction protein DptG
LGADCLKYILIWRKNMEKTVPISDIYYQILEELSDNSGASITKILEQAIEQYRRQKFWEEVNQSYEKLRLNQSDWQEEISERNAWDITLGDDLE